MIKHDKINKNNRSTNISGCSQSILPALIVHLITLHLLLRCDTLGKVFASARLRLDRCLVEMVEPIIKRLNSFLQVIRRVMHVPKSMHFFFTSFFLLFYIHAKLLISVECHSLRNKNTKVRYGACSEILQDTVYKFYKMAIKNYQTHQICPEA